METKENLFKTLARLWNGKQRTTLLIGMAAVAVLLIAFSNCDRGEKTPTPTQTTFDSQDYVKTLEARVQKVVESIEGAGKSTVMITLEKTEEYVYFTEEKINTDTQEQTDQNGTKQTVKSDKETKAGVVEDKNKGNEVLVTTTRMPQIGGVVVVCEGGGSTLVQERITNTVATVLNIPYNKVFVTKNQR